MCLLVIQLIPTQALDEGIFELRIDVKVRWNFMLQCLKEKKKNQQTPLSALLEMSVDDIPPSAVYLTT